MTLLQRVDDVQRRHRWMGLPLAVLWKFLDDEGTYLAALITYYGFVSLFPLLLLAVTVLGFVLQGDPAAQQVVLNSALRNFPVVGDQIGANVHSLHGSVGALVAGVLISIYGGLGVTQAVQNALNRMWAVPKAARPGLPAAYARGTLSVVVLGGGVLAATAASGLGATLHGILPPAVVAPVRVVSIALAVAINATVILLGFRVLTAKAVTVRQLLPGTIVAAVAWQILQTLGGYLVRTELAGTSASYGLFGIVLGLLAWIYFSTVVALFCAEINTVRVLGLYPRSLLSAMPDDTALTPADRLALTAYVTTERQKSYQNVQVTFDDPPPPPPPPAPPRADPGR